MSRLGTDDVARAHELCERLLTLSEGDGPVLDRFTQDLRDYLETARAISYGVALEEGGCSMAFLYSSRQSDHDASITSLANDWLSSGKERFGLYTPAHVERFQQNRAMEVSDFEHLVLGAEGTAVSLSRLGLDAQQEEATLESLAHGRPVFTALGVVADHCLRALVCDGSALRAWVGAFQPEPVRPRQRMLLQAVVPTLQRRLALEARLGEAPLHFAALEAALEGLASAAYVIGPSMRVRLANSAGRLRLDQDRQAVKEALRDSLLGRSTAFSMTRLSAPGLCPHHLAVEQRPGRDPALRAASARAHYGLTPREEAVLARVLRGSSNKSIALELQSSERTVEVHVTHLFAKVGVGSRSALIARLWMEAE